MGLLVYLELLLLVAVFSGSSGSLYSAFGKASASWGVLVLASSEFLSLSYNFKFFPVLIFWLFSILSTFVMLIKKQGGLISSNQLKHLWGFIKSFKPLLVPIGLSLAVILFIGFACPPNNYDSMTYHMSRVGYWMQNGSIEFYPTHNDRQNFLGPFAEIIILHIQVLNKGGDWAANSVQAVGLVGSMVMAAGVVKVMGWSKITQVLTALLIICTPMVILQSSSTQNDVVCSWWVVCAVYFLEKDILEIDERGKKNICFASLCAGLAILTKGTAYIFLAPFIIYYLAKIAVNKSMVFCARNIAIMGVLIICINGTFWHRNFQTYSHPLGNPLVLEGLRNEKHGFPYIAMNLIRNFTLHLGTPIESLNHKIFKAVSEFSSFTGVDINDSAITYADTEYRIRKPLSHEDGAGNHIIFFLFFVAIFVSAWLSLKQRKVGRARMHFVFGLLALSTLLLFISLFKWQPWHSRLHTPFFVLASVFIAPLIELLRGSIQKVILFGLAVWLCSLPYLVFNRSRSLVAFPPLRENSMFSLQRNEVLFFNQPYLHSPYANLIQELVKMKCEKLGYIGLFNTWDYPFFSLARQAGLDLEIQHILVENPTSSLSYLNSKEFRFCAVLVADSISDPGKNFTNNYSLIWNEGPLTLYVPNKESTESTNTAESFVTSP